MRRILQRGTTPARWLLLAVVFLVAVGSAVVTFVTNSGPDYSKLRVTIAAGTPGGVYYPLGGALGTAWSHQLGISAPTVLATNGSVDNIDRLRSGQANVAIAAADAADDAYSAGFGQLRALGRLYDDYLQVVVRADAPVHRLADLKGHRYKVSLGAPNSGTAFTADKLLVAAGLNPTKDVTDQALGLGASVTALEKGQIEAFFWSGGLPTPDITALARRMPIRLLDLSDVVPALQRLYPIYTADKTGTVPASAYTLANPTPPTTLVVPDMLLVTAAMPADEADALTRVLFAAKDQIDSATEHVGLQIDVLHAIYTSPIPLHDGALNYYRSSKI